MWWIKSGIENPSKSEVIGRCGGDGKTEWPRRTDKSRTLKKQKTKKHWLTLTYLKDEDEDDGNILIIPTTMFVLNYMQLVYTHFGAKVCGIRVTVALLLNLISFWEEQYI